MAIQLILNIILRERTKEDIVTTKPKLKILPLGGIDEIGKNITVFEYGEDIIYSLVLSVFQCLN